MKFRAHDTFFIRKGWLSKGMRNVVENPDVFVTKDKNRNPMDVLGIGANMVKALRYWMQVVGLTQEPNNGVRHQTLTELGEIIYRCDPYIEEIGTLWLLQYEMAKNEENATAWYFFFNKFSMIEFTKDVFVQAVNNYVVFDKGQPSLPTRSLNDDFSCIINTYVPRAKSNPTKVSPENNIDCPFGELGLIDIISKDGKSVVYKKSIPSADNINPWIVLAIIYEQAEGKTEIRLSDLLMSPNNIGRVFNLDSITMLEILRRAERTGLLKIVRTAGLDYIKVEENHTFIECVENYYVDTYFDFEISDRTQSIENALSIDDNTYEWMIEQETRAMVERFLSILTPKEAEVIRMRYGIGYDEPMTLEAIGSILNVTRERVRQIETKAMRRLVKRKEYLFEGKFFTDD